MTEAEAKTKWCPFTRTPASVLGRNDASLERNTASAKCIASACMAWRWIDTGFKWEGRGPRPAVQPGKIGSGYCGLARAPETSE